MTESLKTEGEFTYAEAGEGRSLIILHGLMGALSNFDETFQYFSKKGYRVLIPELPLYTLPLLKTNVKHLAKFIHEFIRSVEPRTKSISTSRLPSIARLRIRRTIFVRWSSSRASESRIRRLCKRK